MNPNDFLSARAQPARPANNRNATPSSLSQQNMSVQDMHAFVARNTGHGASARGGGQRVALARERSHELPNIAELTAHAPCEIKVARFEDIHATDTSSHSSRVVLTPFVAEGRNPVTGDEVFAFAPNVRRRQDNRAQREEQQRHRREQRQQQQRRQRQQQQQQRQQQQRQKQPYQQPYRRENEQTTWPEILGVQRHQQFESDPRFIDTTAPGQELEQIQVSGDYALSHIEVPLGRPHQQCVIDTVRQRNECGGFISTQIAGALAGANRSLAHPLLQANEATELRVALLREQQATQGLVGLRYNDDSMSQ